MSTKQSVKLVGKQIAFKSVPVKTPKRTAPSRPSTGFTAQIADLEIGECISRIGQLKPDMTLGEFAEQATALKANFRNNIMPSVRGAVAYTAGTYTVEVVTTVTTPGSVYLVAVITRTA